MKCLNMKGVIKLPFSLANMCPRHKHADSRMQNLTRQVEGENKKHTLKHGVSHFFTVTCELELQTRQDIGG